MTKAQTEAAVALLNKKFVANAKKKNINRLFHDFYSDDAVMQSRTVASIRGKKILQFWEKLIITDRATDITSRTKSVQTSGDLTLEIGELSYSKQNRKGELVRTRQKHIVVYQEKGGVLKAVLSAMPPPDDSFVHIQTVTIGPPGPITVFVVYDIENGSGYYLHQHIPLSVTAQTTVTFLADDQTYWLYCDTFGDFLGSHDGSAFAPCIYGEKLPPGAHSFAVMQNDRISTYTTPAVWMASTLSPAQVMNLTPAARTVRFPPGSGVCVCISV